MNFDKFLIQNESTLKAALSNVPALSAYEKQQVSLEQKEGFQYDRSKSYKKQAETRKLSKVLSEAVRTKKNPVVAACQFALRLFDCKENEKQYRRKILGSNTRAVAAPRLREKKQLMEYTPANKIAFAKKYLLPLFLAKNQAFEFDDKNKAVIDQLFRYFIQDPKCKLDLHKGIFICGSVGTGKSSLMKAFARFTKDNNFENSFDVVCMRQVNMQVDSSGLSSLKQYCSGNRLFDDIALRQKKINSFGTQIMPSDEIIQLMYQRFTKLIPRPTHFSSNVDFWNNKELSKIYDERSIDRLFEMCNVVYLGGSSRRRN
jgi:DNA replication protein DnaC